MKVKNVRSNGILIKTFKIPELINTINVKIKI